jgi:hypothetical protein
MEIALAVFLVVVTAGLFGVWRSQAGDPERWRRRLHERRWSRALAWIGCLTAAAAIGAVAGGAPELAAFAVACGAVAALVVFVLWSYARTFGD